MPVKADFRSPLSPVFIYSKAFQDFVEGMKGSYHKKQGCFASRKTAFPTQSNLSLLLI